MQWDPRATRTAGESLGAPVCGTFQNRKSFESEWERALMRNFTDLTIFPPWLSWHKFFFFYFSLFLENFIEWDLWSNIFKFLSNTWFCTSPHVWAGFWQYFGRGWKQDKTKYALSPTCFGCQASDVLGQSGPFSPASSDLLLNGDTAQVTISPPQLPCVLPGKSWVTHPVTRPYRPWLIRAWHGLQCNTPNETFRSCWQGETLPGAL